MFTASKESVTVSACTVKLGIIGEETRVRDLLRRALMVREYRKCAHTISDEESEGRLRVRYLQNICAERAQNFAQKQLGLYSNENQFTVFEHVTRKANRAVDEESLLALLQRSSLPRIKRGRGVTGLARHWKLIKPDERDIFRGVASSKLG